MSITPKSGKHGHGDCDSPSPSPLSGSGPGGHKASFRSTKLARRARSFKEDFLEKISQMRSPATGGHGGRSHSPAGKMRHTQSQGKQDEETNDKGPTIEILVRQVQVALKHFRDVISKKKLEMLSGNGTIVLDNIYLILSALKPLVDNNRSSTVSSATSQVFQCLTRLIRLCDDVMINGDKSSALDNDNVEDIVRLLEDAVQNLIQISQDKLLHRDSGYKTSPRPTYGNSTIEHQPQRNSLPDIPLTQQERLTLEQTGTPGLVRSSHSSESILRDSSPPPKPPLPDRPFISICLSGPDSNSMDSPPPLPPKKRIPRTQQLIGESCNSDSSLLAYSIDRMSLRSRSPEDSSSLLSGSLDSVLNHSREEEEIRALMNDHHEDGIRENDLSEHILHGLDGSYACDDSLCHNHNISMNHSSDLQPLFDNNKRLSNTDSGFVSINSHRNSLQSYRNSQQSSSSQWSQQNSFKQANIFCQQTQSNESIQKSENILISENKIVTETNTRFIEKSITTTSNMSQFSSLSSSHVSDIQYGIESIDSVDSSLIEDLPPAIPKKTKSRKGRYERQPSPYDNVPDNMGGELLVPCSMHQSQSKGSSVRSSTDIDDSEPPPLPVKKRHMFQSVAYSVMAYMEMFGNCAHTNDNEYLRHSVHMVQAQWQNQKSLDSGLTSTQSCSFMQSSCQAVQHSTLNLPTIESNSISNPSPTKSPSSITSNNSLPPALPPKRARSQRNSNKSTSSPPPASPTAVTSTPNHYDHKLSPKVVNRNKSAERTSPIPVSTPIPQHKLSPGDVSSVKSSDKSDTETVNADLDLMEEVDISKYLTFKKSEEDGPELRGGYIDALIVHATKCNKKDEKENGDYSYQEAFLTTYRTFISPFDLVCKLIRRHQYFICQPEKKPRAREAFSLLVSVVSDLTAVDLEDCLVQELLEFIYQLLNSGNLDAAKPLRIKLIDKYSNRQFYLLTIKKNSIQETSLSLAAGSASLLDFKSEQIAEQMTLLDANLFMKIEIPEVLIWAQEQNEERSPNLTKFTEHFNKMSYWARTKILSPQDPKEREKFVMKFIKIMKHLRKMNNFNSYLALLSALDSAPIRRLEWQKHITEGLKEYCALIDSSSSFRAYRQALAETIPPCIPYIGLVLQDLTFVHIGNSNLLSDGTINFSKRWQQFNILENMKRFKKCTYTFKKNERIIAFFDNFQENIGEDAMWQLSESYKPRGGKKTQQ